MKTGLVDGNVTLEIVCLNGSELIGIATMTSNIYRTWISGKRM